MSLRRRAPPSSLGLTKYRGIGQPASVPSVAVSLAGRTSIGGASVAIETLSYDRSDSEVRICDLVAHPYSLHSHRPYMLSPYHGEDVAVPLRGPAKGMEPSPYRVSKPVEVNLS